VLCDDLVLADGEELRVHTAAAPDIALLPAPPELTGGATGPGVPDGAFTRWALGPPATPPPTAPTVTCVRSEAVAAPARTGGSHARASAPLDADFERASHHHVTVPPEVFEEEDGELLLRVRYTGDVARAYVGDRLVADHFWYGPDWEIGLRRHAAEIVRHGIELRILPLAGESRIHVSPAARDGLDAARAGTSVDAVSVVPLRRIGLHASGTSRAAARGASDD
jgi:beta-galactosidase